MKKILLISSLPILLAACATSSKDIASSSVSPLQYTSYECNQLSAEKQRVYRNINKIGARLDEAAENDKAIAGVGIVLFWPALFALGGTKEQESQYAQLKGEYEAIEQAEIQKNCPTFTEAALPKEDDKKEETKEPQIEPQATNAGEAVN